ncbi:hypothetical protein BDZ89DRAFT_1057338 [Hymenopellis radicata]|nr:hypothetical protein BDZ89DRAFT_1057338 [Hymenopellis radicata]
MPAGGSASRPRVAEDVPMQAEGTQSPASVPQPSQPAKTLFGLPQDARRQSYSRPVFNDDYVARFPEDPYGQETAPNARAYRVYVEEAVAFDENMAGLFSAVVTSFLVQVSQNLQADFSEMSALLLHDLVIIQLAMVDGATVNQCNTIPIIFPQCPYQTPLTHFIHHVCQVVPFGIQSMRQLWRKTLAISSEQQSLTNSDLARFNRCNRSLSAAPEVLQCLSNQDAHYTLSVDALDWLYHMSSNPTVHSLVLQGISGLPAESCSYASQRHQLVREALPSLDFPGQPWVVERLCRSYLFLPQVYTDITLSATLQSILINESCDWGPRIRAAAWVAYDVWPSFIDFFSSHSEVLMHPLIWEEIVHFMLASSHFPETDIDECSHRPPPATSPSASLMTGPQVIWTRLQPRIWDRILEWPLLVPYASVPVGSISSYHRTLISTGKLALSHVLRHRDNMDHFTIAHCRHLKLLAFVVGLIADRVVTLNADWTVDFDFLCSVVQELRDVSSSSILVDSQNDGNPLLLCVSKLRSFYHQSSFMSEFHFPSLPSLLQTWANFHNCIQYDSVLKRDHSSDLWLLTDIMGNALSRGYEEAYRIFRDEGWMEIIFTEWAIGGGDMDTSLTRVIGCYIEGLYNLTLNSSRREFCEYLHQPQQLVLSFMLIAPGNGPWDFPSSLRDLVKICPTHTSWRDCDTAMKAILAWAQRPNPEIPLFPWPPCLQKLCTDLGTDCTTAAFRKYSLVECTAHKFSLQHMRNQLEAGLEILHTILENTEHVEGV